MSLNSIIALLDAPKKPITFVGETIWDAYRFCQPLSKPPKESILAVREGKCEVYGGGVVAAANTARDFADVRIVSQTEDISKIRYIEENYNRKLFEVQQLDEVRSLMLDDLPDCPRIAVTDFGHGFIGPDMPSALRQRAKYLAVACQSNAANYGFNLITRWAAADYIVIDEPEARLAAHDRHSPLEDVLIHLAKGRCDKFVVTRGRHGCFGWDGERVHHALALTERVVDTMGAGDAFFAVTAPFADVARIEDLMLLGNAAGALKTQIVGHRESITRQKLMEFLHANCSG